MKLKNEGLILQSRLKKITRLVLFSLLFLFPVIFWGDNAVRGESNDKGNLAPVYGLLLLSEDNQSSASGSEVVIGGYGKYYNSDWSQLPNGKALADKNIPESEFVSMVGDDRKVSIQGQEYVKISDKKWKVKWNNPFCEDPNDPECEDNRKYQNSLFHVLNCKKVVFENINIIQADSDYRASSTIFVEDCEEVIVRNVFIAGTSAKAHIKVEGCERVLIEYVEISGYDYGALGWRSSAGINVENSPLYSGSPNPRDLKWTIIQHCYIHDYTSADKWRNQDGIHLNAASNGIIFNCYFESWGINGVVGDAAVDVSHRKFDESYQDSFFRIERNIFDNCGTVKTSSENEQLPEEDYLYETDLSCKVFWANNLYVNTNLRDYHKGGEVFHVHETYYFDNNDTDTSIVSMFFRMRGGSLFYRNCLTFSSKDKHWTEYYVSSGGLWGEWELLNTDYFTYIVKDKGHHWLRIHDAVETEQTTERKIDIWDHWKNGNGSWFTGNRDQHSVYQVLETGKVYFGDVINCDFRLTKDNPATNAGCNDFLNPEDERMVVRRDFYNKTRPQNPSAGAFETYF